MTLIRWQPAPLQTEMNRLFGSLFDSPTLATRRFSPPMDLVENEASYVLRADLPGLRAQDVKIEFDHNVLTISGERRSEQEISENGYRRVERASGSFARSLTLPAGVDASKIEASFTDGVLELTVPKPEQSKPHRIAINATAPSATEPVATETEAAQPAAA
jgi:HSP20 family protein